MFLLYMYVQYSESLKAVQSVRLKPMHMAVCNISRYYILHGALHTWTMMNFIVDITMSPA